MAERQMLNIVFTQTFFGQTRSKIEHKIGYMLHKTGLSLSCITIA